MHKHCKLTPNFCHIAEIHTESSTAFSLATLISNTFQQSELSNHFTCVSLILGCLAVLSNWHTLLYQKSVTPLHMQRCYPRLMILILVNMEPCRKYNKCVCFYVNILYTIFCPVKPYLGQFLATKLILKQLLSRLCLMVSLLTTVAKYISLISNDTPIYKRCRTQLSGR